MDLAFSMHPSTPEKHQLPILTCMKYLKDHKSQLFLFSLYMQVKLLYPSRIGYMQLGEKGVFI